MYLLQMDELVKNEKRGYMNWTGWRSHKKKTSNNFDQV